MVRPIAALRNSRQGKVLQNSGAGGSRNRRVRLLIAVLALFLLGLQYRLWVGEGSLAQKAELQRTIADIQQENASLKERNQQLAREVEELKKGPQGIEGKARADLGMIKEGETFFMVVQPDEEPSSEAQEKP